MALVVFTGGARSGKSAAAQRLAHVRELDGASVYVVVFGRDRGNDPEFGRRIERHRADRPAPWTTIEATATRGWLGGVPDDALLLVDCIGTLLGLAMEESCDGSDPLHASTRLATAPADALADGYEAAVRECIDAAIAALLARTGDTIVVTNEVGDGVVPAHATGRVFRDVLGAVNRVLVGAADTAYLCVAGRLLDLSALPRDARWPED